MFGVDVLTLLYCNVYLVFARKLCLQRRPFFERCQAGNVATRVLEYRSIDSLCQKFLISSLTRQLRILQSRDDDIMLVHT